MKSFTVLVVLCAAFVAYSNEAYPAHTGLSSGSGKYLFRDPDTNKHIQVYYYKPNAFNANTPVVMVLHGRKRNAKTYRNDWQELAERHNLMVLVPLFDNTNYPGGNGYNLGNIFTAFNKAEINGYASSGIVNPVEKWSYSLPDRVFADFRQREITNQFGYTLYGHGAGGQFATRFTLMMPFNHACRVIAANPGWFTYLDRSVNWPYGLEGVNWVSDAQIDNYLRSPFVLMLGDDDTEDDGIIRKTPGAEAQGKNRKERGIRFFNHVRALTKKHTVKSAWQLVFVRYATHSDTVMSAAAASHITSCI